MLCLALPLSIGVGRFTHTARKKKEVYETKSTKVYTSFHELSPFLTGIESHCINYYRVTMPLPLHNYRVTMQYFHKV